MATRHDGEHWLGPFVPYFDLQNYRPFKSNLPQVPITDLRVHENDLLASTQGREFWILDDVTPLRQLDYLGSAIDQDPPVTRGAEQRYAGLTAQRAGMKADLNRLIEVDVAGVQCLAGQRGCRSMGCTLT
jgi:hypothetical protein